MRLWSEPITDRTQADVDYAKELITKGIENMTDAEKDEYMSGLKGALNISDLERIQNDIGFLSDVLELNLTVSDVPTFPKYSFYNALRNNVQTIRNNASLYHNTPQVPAMPLNDFNKWNDIETILSDVYNIIINNLYYYCGTEIIAGEETGYLL